MRSLVQKITTLTTIILVSMLWSCKTTIEETGLTPFVNESFADLSVETLSALETPYEAVFGQSAGGRLQSDFGHIAEIAAQLEEIFPDVEILEIEVDTERGLNIWEIKLKMPTDGILKLKFVQELGEIIKMKGVTGPYDYEINPGGSFISFQQAKVLALNAVDGEIHVWSLELEEENAWEYEFQIVNGDQRFEVEINGFELEVLSIKIKDDDQDEDNDGEDEGEDEDEDGEEEEAGVEAPERIVLFAQELFEGEVIHSEQRHTDTNAIFWYVFLANSEDAVVKIKIKDFEDELSLYLMEGEHGPFTYNVDPGMELLTLEVVLEDVYRETENAALIEWRLKQEHEGDEIFWVYEFKLESDTARYYVKINATSGEFIDFEVGD